MGRKWVVEIEGRNYMVEARYGHVSMSGEVLVDGKIVDAWGSSWLGLPQERVFELAGRKALLGRKGLLWQNFELFVEGGKVKRKRK